jgi:hypothetical protein
MWKCKVSSMQRLYEFILNKRFWRSRAGRTIERGFGLQISYETQKKKWNSSNEIFANNLKDFIFYEIFHLKPSLPTLNL